MSTDATEDGGPDAMSTAEPKAPAPGTVAVPGQMSVPAEETTPGPGAAPDEASAEAPDEAGAETPDRAGEDGEADKAVGAAEAAEADEEPVEAVAAAEESENSGESGDAEDSGFGAGDEASRSEDGDDAWASGLEYSASGLGEGGPSPEYDEEDADFPPADAAPQRVRRWPRVLLTLGFVALAAAIVGGAVAIVGSVTHGFKKPVKVTYTKSAVFSLQTGDCFNPKGQSYSLTPCDAPHAAEVFATFALAGTNWPGNAAVAAAASGGCASRLTGYLNPQLSISLASTYVYPDETAWQAGTRTVICEVRATSGQLNGSVRGAAATTG